MKKNLYVVPLLLAALCSAQDDPAVLQARAVKKYAPIVSMSFGGGTLESFVAAVRKAEPKANIIVAAAAADVRVPAMEIKDAGLDQVLESACAAAESDKLVGCSEQRGNGEPVFAIVTRSRSSQQGRSSQSADHNMTTVVSLNRLTKGDPRYLAPGYEGLKVETILSAIEASSYFDEKAPKMRYHQDSGLLFLHGTSGQLGLAAEVLSILERDQSDRAKGAMMQQRATGLPGKAGTEKKDR